MHVCMCVHMHLYMYVCPCLPTCLQAHMCMCEHAAMLFSVFSYSITNTNIKFQTFCLLPLIVCVCVSMYVCVYTCILLLTCQCLFKCVCEHKCVCVCTCMCMQFCVFSYSISNMKIKFSNILCFISYVICTLP